MTSAFNEAVRQDPSLCCPWYCCWQNRINVCGYDLRERARVLHKRPTDTPAADDRCCSCALDLPGEQFRRSICLASRVACRACSPASIGEKAAVKPRTVCPEADRDMEQPDPSRWGEEPGRHVVEFDSACIAGNWSNTAVNQPRLGELNVPPLLDYLMNVYDCSDTIRGTVPADVCSKAWPRWRCCTAEELSHRSRNATARVGSEAGSGGSKALGRHTR